MAVAFYALVEFNEKPPENFQQQDGFQRVEFQKEGSTLFARSCHHATCNACMVAECMLDEIGHASSYAANIDRNLGWIAYQRIPQNLSLF